MKLFFTIILAFTLFSNSAFAQQNYKDVAGFYNLSGFEMSSGLYLLENKTFFYYATFGNADLKFYGTYTIANKTLHLQPAESLNTLFSLYGLKTESRNTTVKVNYYRPYSPEAEHIQIETHNKTYKFPEFSDETDDVSMTLKLPEKRTIKLSIIEREKDVYNGEMVKAHELPEVQIAANVSEIVLFHNYYYDMIAQVSAQDYTIDKGILIIDNYSNSQTKERKEIPEHVVKEVIAFIETLKTENTSIVIDKKTYYKL
ncbi:hypothetical protein [uncultured Formosa sp.]|uniref:hypothetical protein n=1 Tax=uncultured Formosa sp. TaxID=255435 RepID=UPI00260A3C6D|nr:hypothetical protein [uncultured Formosa sp.]